MFLFGSFIFDIFGLFATLPSLVIVALIWCVGFLSLSNSFIFFFHLDEFSLTEYLTVAF